MEETGTLRRKAFIDNPTVSVSSTSVAKIMHAITVLWLLILVFIKEVLLYKDSNILCAHARVACSLTVRYK